MLTALSACAAGQLGVRLGALPGSLNFSRSSGLALGPGGDLFMISEGAVLVVR